ncbi:MAG: cyanophycin synthetase [Chloroflexota bacterium]|nr:cyanophycin synthetase [Chloroflexota bacterium]
MESRGVTVRDLRALRGPNLWSYKPALHAVVDIGPYEELPSTSFPGFTERLTAWLPSLREHECGIGKPGGFVERLETGTYLGHIVEHVTLALQNEMGFDVGYGRARMTDEPGVYNVVIAYQEEEAGRAAFETALRMVLAAMHDEPFDAAGEIERLRELADEVRLGPSTAAIVEAARKRDIPVLGLTDGSSLVQLGYGVHQKRIMASETSTTSSIAVEICQDKPLTNRMLRTVGVPVPEGRTVGSAEEAWTVAQDIGLPIVVKPEAGNQGKGVTVNLRSEAEVRAAYELARQYDRCALVERHVVGDDYRLLVVNGKMVAAARRDPAQVVGDGRRTVRELVDEVNADPRRREGHGSVLTRIQLGEAAALVLEQQGLTFDSVPAAGQRVKLRSNGNLSTGGTATDVTDDVHPANARVAELAAQILALDVAGIDVLCGDIGRPLTEQGGAIVEVNAAPGLRMHLAPTVGQGRDVGMPIVEMLYPDGAPSRIPIVAITGTNGKTTVTRLAAHIFATARKLVGMTCTDGTFIGGERIIEGDCSGPRSAQAVLLHPWVEVAVLETARGGILREGLAFDACAVGVVTNIAGDHLGLKGINTVEQLARVKQVVVESVRQDGAAVLNADDQLVAEMAASCPGRIVYFGLDPGNPVLASHLADGGAAAYVEGGAIVLADEGRVTELIELDRVGFTLGGKVHFQVQNALAAAAAAWMAGLNPALIARALTTFTTDGSTVPGRFNLHEISGVQVVVDYGHNAAAMQALGQAVQALGPRRTVMLMTLPGDRRDEDLRATLEATFGWVHEYVFYDEPSLRGRALEEVPRLLLSHLAEDGRAAGHVARDVGDALAHAWRRLRPGDRLVFLADDVAEAMDLLRAAAKPSDADAACTEPVAARHASAPASAREPATRVGRSGG